MEPLTENEKQSTFIYNPISFVLHFLASYGWYLVGGAAAILYLMYKLRPSYERWRQAREDAEYHKDPDVALARMQAIQLARERQQRLLEEASAKALRERMEREERKRAEAAEKLRSLEENGGQRLGTGDDYLPLSGGPSTSSYRPPKRSACSRGGCGRSTPECLRAWCLRAVGARTGGRRRGTAKPYNRLRHKRGSTVQYVSPVLQSRRRPSLSHAAAASGTPLILSAGDVTNARGARRRPAARRQCSAGRHTEWTGAQCARGEKKTSTMLFESPNAKLYPAFNIPPPVRLSDVTPVGPRGSSIRDAATPLYCGGPLQKAPLGALAGVGIDVFVSIASAGRSAPAWSCPPGARKQSAPRAHGSTSAAVQCACATDGCVAAPADSSAQMRSGYTAFAYSIRTDFDLTRSPSGES
ncbi:unnamed protein product, partial [Iphiclides podalirius]